jgi:hypothetical protein
MGARNRVGIELSYRPGARLQRPGGIDSLESIPRLLNSLKILSLNLFIVRNKNLTFVHKSEYLEGKKHIPSGAAVAKIGETCALHKCCINLHTFRMSQGKRETYTRVLPVKKEYLSVGLNIDLVEPVQ